jgi:hypothetical protein
MSDCRNILRHIGSTNFPMNIREGYLLSPNPGPCRTDTHTYGLYLHLHGLLIYIFNNLFLLPYLNLRCYSHETCQIHFNILINKLNKSSFGLVLLFWAFGCVEVSLWTAFCCQKCQKCQILY